MKTTVKTANGRAVVQPFTISGAVALHVTSWTGDSAGVTLTPDEAGALIFGIEQALQVLEVQRANYGAQVAA